ncbi:MAG: BMC domain-containing protein [Myxococcales bacterium]|nr:BMC domain-containing protein [Myxococcales bacterium]
MPARPNEPIGSAPALAVLELSSIARGVAVADALSKRARSKMLRADPITPGKFLLIFVGEVAEVEQSLEAALEVAGDRAIDHLFLPQIHEAIVPALEALRPPPLVASLGILEMGSAAATILAADAALKEAEVQLAALHLCRGIGGKGYLAFTGTQDAVEAALEAGDEAVEPRLREGRERIARPHPDVDWVLARL